MNGPHYFVVRGAAGYGWHIAYGDDLGDGIVAGPYTTLEQAHAEALRLNEEARSAPSAAPSEAPVTAAAGASDVARNALALTFERYDAELDELRARVAVHDDELAELRRIVGDDGTAHSVAV